MKITKLTTFVVPPRWCFLKVETDEGIVGWGEPVVEGRAHTVAAAVDELADYLIGKDPRQIEDHWTVLYRGGFYRGGAIHMSALAGIDQALWDIKGKALGVPVYELLGGKVRDRIRVYSWIGGDRPSETAAQARERAAGAADQRQFDRRSGELPVARDASGGRCPGSIVVCVVEAAHRVLLSVVARPWPAASKASRRRPASVRRRLSSPRRMCDLTVPRGTPVCSAIAACERSS